MLETQDAGHEAYLRFCDVHPALHEQFLLQGTREIIIDRFLKKVMTDQAYM
jgi:hypothetical protein